LSGIFASYANTFVSMGCNFIVIPLYIHYLGAEQYGLWLTASALTAYLGLVNLGITQTTANCFGAAVARKGHGEASRYLATAFWFYIKVVIVLSLLILTTGPWLPWTTLFKGSSALAEGARPLLLVASLSFLFELPFSIFGACLSSIGRIKAHQQSLVFQSIVRLATSFLCVTVGVRLLVLVVLLSLTNVLTSCLHFWLLRKAVPGVSAGRTHVDKALQRTMTNPSFLFFVLQMSAAIAFSTDVLVISTRLGTALVSAYSISQRLAFLAIGMVSTITSNYQPLFLEAYIKRDHVRLRALFLQCTWLSALLGITAALSLLVVGPFAIRLWVGKANYVGWFPFSMQVALVAVQVILMPAHGLLTVTNHHKRYAYSAAWEAVLNLGLSILLAGPLGVGGVAMATLAARLLGAGPVLLLESRKLLRFPEAASALLPTSASITPAGVPSDACGTARTPL
jgi:O-antigen/teichoic acid export membrane protein